MNTQETKEIEEAQSKLNKGIFLYTSQQLKEEQKQWHEYDESKNKDFSMYPYFLVTDNGFIEGISSLDDIPSDYCK